MPDLPYSTLGRAIENAGAPSNGTSEVQTVTISAFGASVLTLSFMGASISITFTGSETNSAIDTAVTAAMVALRTVGSGGVTTSTSGTTNRAIAITFASNLGKLDVDALGASITGSGVSVAVAITTPGVTATARGQAGTGQLLIDSTNGILYINTGTALAPTWTKVGTQT